MTNELLIPVLAFSTVMFVGCAVFTVRSARRARLLRRLQGLPAMRPSRQQASASRLNRALDTLGSTVSSGKTSRSLKEELARAGFYAANAASVYLGAKVLLFMAGLAGLSALLITLALPMPVKVLAVLGGTALLFFAPNIVVARRRAKRAAGIRQHLPEAIDLLEISISSGMGVDMAWNAVAEEIRRVSPDLADEMELTNLEIHLGATRTDAMRHMADRTKVEELGSLVAVIVQSDRFGTSIAEALRTFAAFMRDTRFAKIEEASEKIAVKLLLPMILFIFPVVFIVLAGPAGIRLAQIISQG